MIEIPGYELFERIGAGGMGEVWTARHEETGAARAVKVLLSEKARSGDELAELATRFRGEATVLMTLRSPHTIRVHDWGQDRHGRSLWLAMDLLEGLDLETLVSHHGPLPHGRAIHLLRQVCESLAEAHDKGLVHRDLKPANVFVCQSPPDHVVVLDFGLARVVEPGDRARLTATGTLPGTPIVMAPEQFIVGAPVDPRTDIYALGCVAFWLLTGERVFPAGDPLALLYCHVNEPPRRPSSVVPSIPPELDALVLRCLAKEPGDRPASAAEVAEELASCPGAGSWAQQDAVGWWAAHPAPRHVVPAPPDPLIDVLASFGSLDDLVDFLWRDVQPPEEGRALKERVAHARTLGEAAGIAARELRARNLLGRDLLELLRQKVPSRRAEIDALAEGRAIPLSGRGARPASRPSGRPPLPDSRFHLDRTLQWLDLVERSRSKDHEVFLLHGPANQHLGDFTRRVEEHLNRELRERWGSSQGVRVVSADRDADGWPHLPAIWKKRFAAAVGLGLAPSLAVEEAARHEPLLVLFGKVPLSPPSRTREQDYDALLEFLAGELPAIVGAAELAHEVRFYLALECADGDPNLARMASALGKLAGAIGSSFSLDLAPGVQFPALGDIEDYVRLYQRQPSEDWWARLRACHEGHRAGDGDFRAFCLELDALLRLHDGGILP